MESKTTYSKSSLFIFILSFPISFLYFYALRYILPKKFFFDNGTIREAMEPGAIKNDYSATGDFYKKIGFHWDTPFFYEILFSALIFTVFVFLLVFMLKIDFSRLTSLCWIAASLLFFGPFYSMMSKDLIVFIYLLISFAFFKRKMYPFILVIVATLYAINYREYWFITIGLTLFLWVTVNGKKNKRILKIILFIAVYMVAISIVYHLQSHSYLSAARANVNQVRINDMNSRTMTRTVLPPTNLGNDLINTIYNAVNLFIPIDGLGSINELAYYFWLYMILGFIWWTYKKCKRITGNTLYYLLFFASFMFTQSLFEPDMGSVFRHQLVVTLFIPFMLQSYQQKYASLDDNKTIEKQKATLHSS